jgi:catechol 2,3-dioxygenase-like lactoylglutathione lyase family enzyme
MGARARALTLGVVGLGACLSAVALATADGLGPSAQTPLPPPSFHHLHLNSVNPEAAIDFYVKAFPSTSKGTFAGQPALQSPNNVWVLFNKVAAPPATQPQTAFWHFGWHVTDVRATLDRFLKQNITLVPLYTGAGEGTGTVFVSSDTYPGTGGVLGLTRAQVADARAKGVKPNGGAGFAYLRGPDDALVEYQGNMPVERFNHVHMYQEQPFCAALWYQSHLNVPAPRAGASASQAARTAENCMVARGEDKTLPALDWDGMYRTPSVTSTMFGDVSLFFYMNQGNTPAGSTRGHLMDHIAVSVADLDAWIAKLKAENVTFLEQPYTVGGLRAVMIEGPSKEAIELVEVK